MPIDVTINYPTFFADSNAIASREGETWPLTEAGDPSFTDGCNLAGSNANGIGFGSGVVNFKEQDYPIPSPNAIQRSSYIGYQEVDGVVTPTAISAGGGSAGDPPTGPNSLITPVTAAAQVLPGAVVETVETFDFTNQTGETLEAGDRVFGIAANP